MLRIQVNDQNQTINLKTTGTQKTTTMKCP